MRPSRQSVVAQSCPNCQRLHDTSVYVSGQKVTCACGIKFEVRRMDVAAKPAVPARPANAAQDSSLGPTISPPSKQNPTPLADNGTFVHQSAVQIPGYELIELLGKGGMGEVWRARQLSLDRIVAVKLLPPKLARDQEFISRFDKEATALAALSHPNITQIIDRGVAGEHYYFAMELVVGKTMRDVMNAGRPAPAEALRLAVQICRAIDYAHEQKIVHRDLKPENILIDARNHVKVADFGLAGMRGSDKNLELTATAVAMGTVNYMAPEQRRDAKHVDHRADLFSLGVMLYELLTGELPIGRFKNPSAKVDGLDPRLDELICSMLETDPMQRPASAGDVCTQLEACIPGSASVPPQQENRDTQPDRPTALAKVSPPSVVDRTWSGFKVGLMVLGALALVVLVVRALPQSERKVPTARAAPQWYSDTDDELFSTSKTDDEGRFSLDFEPNGQATNSGESLNAHCGVWRLEDGALTAVQWGNPTDMSENPRLVPRAYVSQRYFTANEITIESDLQLEDLSGEFPPLANDAQRFGEVSFRIKDLQVSIYAIPEAGMRLMWRYFTPDGVEVADNSARDLSNLVEDEMQVPLGRFKVKLKLQKNKAGLIDVEAFVNGQRFAHKVLPGLAGQVGKVALGCRNLSCRFDDLKVTGKPAARPAPRKAEQ